MRAPAPDAGDQHEITFELTPAQVDLLRHIKGMSDSGSRRFLSDVLIDSLVGGALPTHELRELRSEALDSSAVRTHPGRTYTEAELLKAAGLEIGD